MSVFPPTTYLPPISKLSHTTSSQLLAALTYLHTLYLPKVRGSRRVRARAPSHSHSPSYLNPDSTPDSKYPSNSSELDLAADLSLIRSDTFERAYAIRWLTTLIAKIELCPDLLDSAEQPLNSSENDTPSTDVDAAETNRTANTSEHMIQKAAALLAICAGVAAAGRITRTFSFTIGSSNATNSNNAADRFEIHVKHGPTKNVIEVQLTDIPLENSDYASVGAQTWGGACVLAEMIVDRPVDFGIVRSDFRSDSKLAGTRAHFPRGRFRVLELGAGTGLVSLAIANLMRVIFSKRAENTDLNGTETRMPTAIDIVATDFHPSVLANLKSNIQMNGHHFDNEHEQNDPNIDIDSTESSAHSSLSITSHFLDWSQLPSAKDETGVFAKPFDLVVGADIIYESSHALWIKGCLERFLRRPRPNSESGDSDQLVDAIFHLVIPLRPTHTMESSTIEAVFPSSRAASTSSAAVAEDGANTDISRGEQLVILSKETVVCDADADGGRTKAEEVVEYVYYRIGWEAQL
ncbi:hypothetical protein BJ138DRAFT_1162980 [Hygrophoropsis aurantiaca]|uniref:Uncharacterized protein n=1 Tax=Hygrophoropsis aurantiaca TaxID=72124 RepID=A0ACB8A040_9AGAM|nr:hypothetical protein BJ138DRAFT_1162980 [Hygrophoropsis aurantiaca]